MHRGLHERREAAPAARVDVEPGVDERPDDLRPVEQRELAEDPAVVVGRRVAERRRSRARKRDRLAARHGEDRVVDVVELGPRAERLQQLVRGEVPAPSGEGERQAADVPERPRPVDVGACPRITSMNGTLLPRAIAW